MSVEKGPKLYAALSLLRGVHDPLKGFLARSILELALTDRPFCFGFARCFSRDGLCSSCKYRDECALECVE
ncbi:hypothetical protein B6U99_07550 [Candidatus Geothermarchaeota archaeon ex4572_27]|nr:MAG: hypothetical protein B6U99_07550 [Candidatus Geothermarchaeota archaeon ex4572_27]